MICWSIWTRYKNIREKKIHEGKERKPSNGQRLTRLVCWPEIGSERERERENVPCPLSDGDDDDGDDDDDDDDDNSADIRQ